MICAIYARYSSENQKETSIEDQIRECKTDIEHRGWVHSDDQVYTDYAISGSDNSRPGYLALKAAAQQQLFDAIVVDDLSRLGRDAGESINAYKEFQAHGVVIVSIADGIDTSRSSGKIPLYFKGIMNEMFLDDMKAKVIRGLKGQVLRGYSAGGRVYGYKTVPDMDPSGEKDKFGHSKRLGCRIHIDKDQARVVRRIFELRNSGLGYRAIAYTLNDESIPGPRADTAAGNKHWSSGTIRTILLNKKYIGLFEYNKARYLNKRIPGLRRLIDNKETELVRFESEDLRIIPDALFYIVNDKIRKRTGSNNLGREKYLLSGLIKCGECGSSMVIQNARNHSSYICRNARNKGPRVCTNNHRIHRRAMEKLLFAELQKVLFSPIMISTITRKMNQRIKTHLSGNTVGLVQLKQKQRELKRQIGNLLVIIENGNISSSMGQRIEQREQELREINNKIRVTEFAPDMKKTLLIKDIGTLLKKLSRYVLGNSGNIVILRNCLKNLFPERLEVVKSQQIDGLEFRLKGNASPFNLLMAGNVHLSLASPSTLSLNQIRKWLLEMEYLRDSIGSQVA